MKKYFLLFLIFLNTVVLFGEIKVFINDSCFISLNDSCLKNMENSNTTIVKGKYLKIGKTIVPNPLVKLEKTTHSKRFTAVVITLLTGPLGGHRIYLGTKPVIPVVYALTLGGGVFVTVIDLIALVVTRDISIYEDNISFFMWKTNKL